MALASNLLPTKTEDVVKITTGSGADEKQIFVAEVSRLPQFGIFASSLGFVYGNIKASPLKAFIKRETQAFTHPLENSTTLIDHRIILPIIINIPFMINRDYNNTLYQEIEQYFNDGTTVNIYTKTRKYSNFFISSMPHDEVPDRFDSLIVDVTFQEIQVPIPGLLLFNPSDAEQVTTVDRGVLQFIDVAIVNAALTFN